MQHKYIGHDVATFSALRYDIKVILTFDYIRVISSLPGVVFTHMKYISNKF